MKEELLTQDVGKILVKVQNNLSQLREKFLTGDKDNLINAAELDQALTKTEQDLQDYTEDVVYCLHNQMQVISHVEDPQQTPEGAPRWSDASIKLPVYTDNNMDVLPTSSLATTQSPTSLDVFHLKGLSPGQKHKRLIALKRVVHPENLRNQEFIKASFGVQLPLISQGKVHKIPGKLVSRPATVHHTVLPKANRVDASLTPPPLQDSDARQGILNLLDRGLIPPAARLTLDPSPIKNQLVQLKDPEEKKRPTDWPMVKLDPVDKKGGVTPTSEVPKSTSEKPFTDHGLRSHSGKLKVSSTRWTTHQGWRTSASAATTLKLQQQILPPPSTPVARQGDQASHMITIQNGKTRDDQPEFINFRQHNIQNWGSIVSMIHTLEGLLTKYCVPVAFIHEERLAALSMKYELGGLPPRTQLLDVMVNRQEVEHLLTKPGQVFKGPRGKEMAAVKIQASWRRHKQRTQYLEHRRLKWAAGVIALSWVLRMRMVQMRLRLKKSRQNQLNSFKLRAKMLALSWERIKNSRRVVIHIPSLGYSENIRNGFSDFELRENAQMPRLCDIKDPNVDVILVAAVPLSDETFQYYSKLLGLGPAVTSGNPEDQQQVTDRYKIIVPEAINKFPTHRMCLSTILKYSPRALKRIKNLIKGREAYIVPGMPHKDDLAVADFLDVPVLGPEPDLAHLYSTKSGSKRVFTSAGVNTPPSEHEIYSIEQLHECLAQLVTSNLHTQRWLFKLEHEFDGWGVAVCDVVQHLRCYQWALRERQRYGDKWSKQWAQEAAYIKILAEIPDILQNFAKPVNTKMFSTWDKFLSAFLLQGGVVEGCPPSDSVTMITTNVLIEPSGNVSVLMSGDQVHAENQFSCWGVSVPQLSIEPGVLNTACQKISTESKSRGITGYLRIDFATFIHPEDMTQRLWAMDLHIHYSDQLALFRLMEYVTQGRFQPETHDFQLPLSEPSSLGNRNPSGLHRESPKRNRYALMSTNLLHSNLAIIHYSVFFQMCRAHGLGYDIKDKSGTLFTLIDSFTRERLGILTISDSLQGSLSACQQALQTIHREISVPGQSAANNFKDAITNLDEILGTTLENVKE